MFNKLKSMVWTDDAQAAAQQKPAALTSQVPAGLVPSIEMPVVDSVLNVNEIQQAIVSNIESSPEFEAVGKFIATTASLAKVIPAEATRFQAAQVTVAATKDQLLQSVKSFEGVLAAEKENFLNTFVQANENQINTLIDNGHGIEAQIADLNNQLQALVAQREQINADVTTKTAELAKAKIDFDSVIATLTRTYTDMSNKINQFLQA